MTVTDVNPDAMSDDDLADWLVTDAAADWLLEHDRVERSPEVEALREARVAVAEAEKRLTAAVAQARSQGLSWAGVGQVLGMTRQGAQQRFGRSGKPASAA